MSHLPAIISDLALILMCAGLVTLIFKRLGQPLVLGYIVAGFLAGLEKGLSQAEAFRLAAAAGTASAFSEDLADGDKIYQLLAACTVTEESGPGF